MINKTYKNLDFTSGSAHEATAENYPACAMFLKCDEVAGSAYITDAITGMRIPVTSLTKPSTNSIKPAAASATPTLGAIPSPNGKHVVALVVGQAAMQAITLGGIAGQNITFSGGIIGTSITGDAGIKVGTTLTGSAGYGAGFKYAIGGNITTFEMNDASGFVEKTPVTMGATTTLVLDNKITLSSSSITELFGMWLFYFDALPNDIEQVVAWCTQAYRTDGVKQLPPHWRGKV